MPVNSSIRSWSQLEQSFRERIQPTLQSNTQEAADRWHSEFVTNPSSAAGFALTCAAMNAAGIWSSVTRVLNAWAVGMFFVPSPDISQLIDRNPNFTAHNSGGFRHRLAHHSYWEKSWIQTNVRQASIHIGINREPENGERKAEVHLDVFNGFHNGFNGVLSVKHVLFEVLLKRSHSADDFEAMLRREGIAIPEFIRDKRA